MQKNNLSTDHQKSTSSHYTDPLRSVVSDSLPRKARMHDWHQRLQKLFARQRY